VFVISVFCLDAKETKDQDCTKPWKQLRLISLYFRKLLYI